MNGKGDSPRKKTVTQEIWDRNWENIFGKKEKENDRGESSNKHKRRQSE
jgi:hypothetical protein